jgi:hypothetical protein
MGTADLSDEANISSDAALVRMPEVTTRMIRIPTMLAITSRNESEPNSTSGFLRLDM